MILQEIWQELERDMHSVSSGYLTRRVMPESVHDIYLAVEKPANMRLFMIRVRRASIEPSDIFPASKGFEVRKVVMPDYDKEHIALQLILIDPNYNDIFSVLVQDIIDRITPLPDEQKAIIMFISRLQQWQSFLKKGHPLILGEEAQRGLYGELDFLRQYAIPNLGAEVALATWLGPRNYPQDFRFGNTAIEVKTSIAKQHQKIFITSERQLDESGEGVIYLYHLSLEMRQGSGESLPEIILRIRDLLHDRPVSAEVFETLLFEAGYLDVNSSYYEKTGYIKRETNFFKVAETFPRIIEKDLRNGVGDVHYSITVAECRHFAVTESDIVVLMRSVNG